MSAAADVATAGAAPRKGKKKLLIIIVAAVMLLALAGGAAMMLMKKKAQDTEESIDEDGAPVAQKAHKVDPKHPPTFVPLEPFVVNLTDKDAERYAQIGITLEIDDAKFADQLKLYMPAIRNGILMILAHKSSQELLGREGKQQLAAEIMRESVRPLGIEVAEAEAEPPPADAGDEEDPKPKKKKKKKPSAEHNPVQQVHFSNFIIQ